MRKDYDVVIVGGGPAGWVAAVAAARQKADTLLIERYGFAGGLATAGLVGPFMRWYNKKEDLVKGIFKEFIDRMKGLDGIIGGCFDPEVYKKVALEMLLESRVKLLFHSYLSDVKVKENLIKSIKILNKNGYEKYSGEIYIDTTGDGDLAYLAGVPYEVGRKQDGLTQSLTLMFQVGGVDFEKAENYYLENKDNFIVWTDDPNDTYFKTGIFARAGFFKQLHQYQNEGKIDKAVKNIFFLMLPRKGYVVFNTTNVIELSGIKAEDLTKAEIIARRQVWQVMNLLKILPGFEKSYLVQTANQIGIRETRRILGEYVFTGDDVKNGATFADVIARANYGIDIHDPKGEECKDDGTQQEEMVYEIPYGSLVPWKIDNLLVAGRCISSTHEGQSAIRIQPTCMAMGEAAGVAASICVFDKVVPRKINMNTLQSTLIKEGVNLGNRIKRPVIEQLLIEDELKKIGIKQGDTLIVHSSLKSIGNVAGGAETVIRALQNVLTDKGTLIMPTFSFSLIQWSKEPFETEKTPSRVGAITDIFRKMEGVKRSNHPTHSIAVWGKLKDELTIPVLDAPPCGLGSPFEKLYNLNAKILMLGTHQDTNTMLHFCEKAANLNYIDIPFSPDKEFETARIKENEIIKEINIKEVPGCSRGFNKVEKPLKRMGIIKDVWIGEARSQILESKKLVKAMNKILRRHPDILLCEEFDCSICIRRRAALHCCEKQ